MTTIYLYGLDPIYDEKMNALVSRYGYDIVRLGEEDLGHLVGYLTGGDFPAGKIPVSHVPETTFLLFDDLPPEELRDFLADLREEVGYFPHKASTTKTNRTWRLEELIRHNMEEHAVMEILTRTMKLLPLAKSLHARFPEDEKLEDAIAAALPFTKPREVELDKISAVYDDLLTALRSYESLFQGSSS